jgi:hypothetical protein
MIERFFDTLLNDETIFSSLSQIGLLSLIVIVSFLLEHSVQKSLNKKEESYVSDDVLTIGLMNIIVFMISSLLLFGEIFRVFLKILIISLGIFT